MSAEATCGYCDDGIAVVCQACFEDAQDAVENLRGAIADCERGLITFDELVAVAKGEPVGVLREWA